MYLRRGTAACEQLLMLLVECCRPNGWNGTQRDVLALRLVPTWITYKSRRAQSDPLNYIALSPHVRIL